MPALKVSSDQRAELRSQAHALKPVVLVGAEGLTDAVLAEIKVHLGAHQLIKIRVFGDEREERLAVYEQICDTLNAAPIQGPAKLITVSLKLDTFVRDEGDPDEKPPAQKTTPEKSAGQ